MLGCLAASCGRDRNCRTAATSNSSPSTNLIVADVSDSPPLFESRPRASTIAPTSASPRIHPSANAMLFRLAEAENSIRITATIGIGLIATPIANGRICPIAEPIRCFPCLSDGP